MLAVPSVWGPTSDTPISLVHSSPGRALAVTAVGVAAEDLGGPVGVRKGKCHCNLHTAPQKCHGFGSGPHLHPKLHAMKLRVVAVAVHFGDSSAAPVRAASGSSVACSLSQLQLPLKPTTSGGMQRGLLTYLV